MNTIKESLQRLANTIDADLGVVTDQDEGGSIVRVLTNGTVAIREIDAHPFDVLLGFVCPDDWAVFGVICHGKGVRPSSLAEPARSGDTTRLRVIHLVDRNATQVSVSVPLAE